MESADARRGSTRLYLGLGLHQYGLIPTRQRGPSRRAPIDRDEADHQPLPSLSLGLSEAAYGSGASALEIGKQALCESTTTDLHREVSSYPNRSSRTRRSERHVEAAELEKTSMISVKDEDCSTPRKKLRLSKEQISILEGSFKAQTTVNPKQKEALARRLHLRPRQVEVWFQNRRARIKLKQTEVDRETLKRHCETLREENRRLQDQVQELKSQTQQMKMPLLAQIPSSPIIMCPSCERIGSSKPGNLPSSFFSSSMPKLRHQLSDPSTAC